MKYESFEEAAAALSYAQTELRYSADHRVKNFNFYIILMGFNVAAMFNSEQAIHTIILSLAGMIFTFAFYIIDLRNIQLIENAKRPVKEIEKMFALSIQDPTGLLKKEGGWDSRLFKDLRDNFFGRGNIPNHKIISHAFCYQLIFFTIFLILSISFLLSIIEVILYTIEAIFLYETSECADI